MDVRARESIENIHEENELYVCTYICMSVYMHMYICMYAQRKNDDKKGPRMEHREQNI